MQEKEKLLVTSNFSFSNKVFHRYISLVHQNVVLCGNAFINKQFELWLTLSSLPFPLKCNLAHPGGSVVSISDSWPGGCEFDPRLRRLFFPVYFCLSPLQKHVRKVVVALERKVVLVLVCRRPGNTCVTDHHHMTLAVKVALNPNTIQPIEMQPLDFKFQARNEILHIWLDHPWREKETGCVLGKRH